MPGYAISSVPPLALHFEKAKRYKALKWEEWQVFDNVTSESGADDSFDEGVVNTIFLLHKAEKIEWADVLQVFRLAPFEKDDRIREVYEDWVKHSPLIRLI